MYGCYAQQAGITYRRAGADLGVIDDDSLTFALALRAKGAPVPDIAKKLTIKARKNAVYSPSVALLYRGVAEAEQADADDDLDELRPKSARILQNSEPQTPSAGIPMKFSRAQ
ncbi:hypothetical protein ABZ890_40835 [Streptomyces sp. NPDC046984]|uniref:hypothetical protein n=1 Tax=Streptomyces sp. NPDC046984 TaxID=3155138 RepID=UPI003406E327